MFDENRGNQSLSPSFRAHAHEGVMEIGLVKGFNNAKGWGFIAARVGSDVFVHYSQIHGDGYRTLREGQHVRYDLRSGPRGQFAENVVVGEEQIANAS